MSRVLSLKKAFLLSLFSLLFSMTLLVGSSYAWFTKVISSSNNKIISGNLEMSLLYDNGLSYIDISNSNVPVFNSFSSFYPGKYQICYLGVKNNGDIDINYSVSLDVRDSGLVGSLEYLFINDSKRSDLASITDINDLKSLASKTGDITDSRFNISNSNNLVEVNSTSYFSIVIYMKDPLDNIYQGKTCSIDVNVIGTQVDNNCSHSFVEISNTATCSKMGVSKYRCSSCGIEYSNLSLPLGHNIVSGECNRCGKEFEVINDLSELNNFFTNDINKTGLLSSNINITSTINVTRTTDLELDLNGYNIKGSVEGISGLINVSNGKTLSLIDSVGSGSLINESNSTGTTSAVITLFNVSNDSSIYIDGVNLSLKGTSSTNIKISGLIYSNDSIKDLTIKNSNIDLTSNSSNTNGSLISTNSINDITISNVELVSDGPNNLIKLSGYNSLTIKDSTFTCDGVSNIGLIDLGGESNTTLIENSEITCISKRINYVIKGSNFTINKTKITATATVNNNYDARALWINNSNITINNSKIIVNSLSDSYSAIGIVLDKDSDNLTITDSTIISTNSGSGGELSISGLKDVTTYKFTNSVFAPELK